MNFTDYQNQPSSEKVVLAVLCAAKRLMGWSVHSGSVYKLENFPFSIIASIKDSGTAYTEVTSLGAIGVSKYYLDRSAKTLYIQATGSADPNSRFLVGTVNLYFANVPIILPHDLASGDAIQWEPLIKSTSQFGVTIDTIQQASEAIEGSGTLTLINDGDFWPQHFDRLTFENQKCVIYSYNRGLDVSEAKYLFKGQVDKKAYTNQTITFNLKDQFIQLQAPVALDTIGDLSERTSTDLANAFQRMVLGRVTGHVPTNLDQVLDGYPVTGTISVSTNGTTVTGSGTQFRAELSPDDKLVFNDTTYTVATITNDTTLDLSEVYSGENLLGASITVQPDQPKRYMNRIHQVAGHALREPTTTVLRQSSNVNTLIVDSTIDIYAGDYLYVEGTTLVQVESVSGNYLRLSTSFATPPLAGTTVMRPAIQNVRIENIPLEYATDYTFDASTGVLTLLDTAESNASPVKTLQHNVTFTNGSRTVTGTGFQGIIKPGYMLGAYGQPGFFEVMSVESDTALTLRTVSTFAGTVTAAGRYKDFIFSPDNMKITLDVLGRTDDGTTTGNLLLTAPEISRALLGDAGLSSELDSSSFDDANDIAYQPIGLVIPEKFDDTSAPTYRDVLNKINTSVFGALVQGVDFKFRYEVLTPDRPTTAVRFSESDLLGFPSIESNATNVVKTTIVQYAKKEYDYLIGDAGFLTQQNTNDDAQYLLGTDNTKTIDSCLVDESDADILAARWSFLLQGSSTRITFTTKMQGALLKVGDIIELEHRKLFERPGTLAKRKLLLVESVQRSGLDVKIEATDFSNTLNKVACINTITNDWDAANEDELLYGGFYSDDNGLINTDESSFATNLIW